MGLQERIELALTALREAQLDESRWQTAAALFDDACGLDGNHLSIISGDSLESAQMLFSQLYKRGEPDEELDLLYRRDYMAIDERLPRLLHLPDGELQHCTELFTELELHSSPTFNEYLVPTGAGNSLNVRSDGPHGLHVVLALVPTGRDSDWTNQQIETIQVLLPHIRHFASVRQALADAAISAVRSATSALGAKRIGIVLLNRHGLIVEANDHARQLLLRNVGLGDVGGSLVAHHEDDHSTLNHLLAAALSNSPEGVQGGVMTIRRAENLPLTLYVSSFSSGDFLDLGNLSKIAVMVMIVDPQNQPQVDANRLAQALSLTPAQARVAAALASGATVQSIAVSTCRSEAVIRWHLKQIMARLGISSQTDLVRIVITTPGVFDN